VRLKKRGDDPDERALRNTQAKAGELTMKLELAEMLYRSQFLGQVGGLNQAAFFVRA